MLLIVKFLVKKSATNFEVFLYLLHELVKSDIYDGDLNADLHSAVQTLDLLTQAVNLVGGGLGLLVPWLDQVYPRLRQTLHIRILVLKGGQISKLIKERWNKNQMTLQGASE